MTNIEKINYKCPKCSTEYEVMDLLSWNSMLGKPDLENQKCPNCGFPYEPDSDKKIEDEERND